jgi:glutaredoxin
MKHDNTYYLYTTAECGFCQRAKELLTEKKLKFVVMELNREHPTLMRLKLEMDWGTVPMIFQIEGRDHKFLGGYTDLLNHLGEQ